MIKTLVHNDSVKLSSTAKGQREMIRKQTNKINELIEAHNLLVKCEVESLDVLNQQEEDKCEKIESNEYFIAKGMKASGINPPDQKGECDCVYEWDLVCPKCGSKAGNLTEKYKEHIDPPEQEDKLLDKIIDYELCNGSVEGLKYSVKGYLLRHYVSKQKIKRAISSCTDIEDEDVFK